MKLEQWGFINYGTETIKNPVITNWNYKIGHFDSAVFVMFMSDYLVSLTLFYSAKIKLIGYRYSNDDRDATPDHGDPPPLSLREAWCGGGRL